MTLDASSMRTQFLKVTDYGDLVGLTFHRRGMRYVK